MSPNDDFQLRDKTMFYINIWLVTKHISNCVWTCTMYVYPEEKKKENKSTHDDN